MSKKCLSCGVVQALSGFYPERKTCKKCYKRRQKMRLNQLGGVAGATKIKADPALNNELLKRWLRCVGQI